MLLECNQTIDEADLTQFTQVSHRNPVIHLVKEGGRLSDLAVAVESNYHRKLVQIQSASIQMGKHLLLKFKVQLLGVENPTNVKLNHHQFDYEWQLLCCD